MIRRAIPFKFILLSAVILAIGGCQTDHDLTANELYVRGQEALKNERPARAADYFTRASDQNHTGATTELGRLYFKGRGVEHDVERAKALWTTAASGGSGEAEHMLGIISHNQEDHQAARAHWKKAAAEGYTPAYEMLSLIHLVGHGVPQDYGKHVQLLREASALGSEKAQKTLDGMIEILQKEADSGNEVSAARLDSLKTAGLVEGK